MVLCKDRLTDLLDTTLPKQGLSKAVKSERRYRLRNEAHPVLSDLPGIAFYERILFILFQIIITDINSIGMFI